jgi:hypothetical protein
MPVSGSGRSRTMNHARKWATRTFYGTLLAGVAVVAAGCGADDSAASTSASAQSASSMVDDLDPRPAVRFFTPGGRTVP